MLRALALLAALALPLAARAATTVPIRYLVDEQALKTADPDAPLVFKAYDDPGCTHEVFGTIFAAPKTLTVLSRLRGLRLPGQSTKAPKAVELYLSTDVGPTGPFYVQVFGQGVTPVGGACQAQAGATPKVVALTHTATAGNISTYVTAIDSPSLNGNPDAIVQATHVYGAGPSGVYDTHPIGVWYNAATSRWTIFHEDLVAVADGATYHVTAVTP